MKIVIEIYDETYQDVVKNGFIYDEDREEISEAIINGTPLPKGHGRLIDADDLIKRTKKFIDVPNKYISQRNKDFIYYLEREETIIPADKEKTE